MRLATADVRHARSASSGRGGAGSGSSRRGPLATIALVILLAVLVGGIYYAAVVLKAGHVGPAVQVAGDRLDDKKATDGNPTTASQDAAAVKTEGAVTPAPAATEGEPMAKVETLPAEVAVAAPPTEPLGLYSERTRADRKEWIGGVGGTPQSELAVAAGLDWLARHQAEDGHWGPDCLGSGPASRCEQERPCDGPGQEFEAAHTGLAVLAFQAGGNYDFNQRPYSENVRRGLDWFVKGQGPNGELVGSRSQLGREPDDPAKYDQRYMYEHAIATFALAEACAVARAAQRHSDERYATAALKAVKFIESQQHHDGGWRYQPTKTDPSDCSVSGWAMLALKTAKEADLPVEPMVVSRMVAFFKSQADNLTGRTHYQSPSFGTDALTGVGMMVDEFLRKEPHSELIQLAAPYLAEQAENGWGRQRNGPSDFYLWYNCTLAMFQAGGETWQRWNAVVRDHIIQLQLHGSDCVRGSWDPTSKWGGYGGRIYTTALAVLTLEVYYRFAREQADQAPAKPK